MDQWTVILVAVGPAPDARDTTLDALIYVALWRFGYIWMLGKDTGIAKRACKADRFQAAPREDQNGAAQIDLGAQGDVELAADRTGDLRRAWTCSLLGLATWSFERREAHLGALCLAQGIGVQRFVAGREGGIGFFVVLLHPFWGAVNNEVSQRIDRRCVLFVHPAVLRSGEVFRGATERLLAEVHPMLITLEDIKVPARLRMFHNDVMVLRILKYLVECDCPPDNGMVTAS